MGIDPVSLAIMGATAMQAVGQVSQGQAADRAGKYNASVANSNATIMEQNALFAGQEGEANAAKEQEKTRQEVGSIKVNQAAAGIDVNRGSAVDVRASQAEVGMLDAATIRSNAARTAYGYQTQEAGFKAEAAMDRAAGKQAKKAAYIGAATTILGGAATAGKLGAFGKWQSGNALQGPTMSGSTLDTVAGGGW